MILISNFYSYLAFIYPSFLQLPKILGGLNEDAPSLDFILTNSDSFNAAIRAWTDYK